jgi:hypothetical protein
MLPARSDQDGPALMTIGRNGAFERLAGVFAPQTQGRA